MPLLSAAGARRGAIAVVLASGLAQAVLVDPDAEERAWVESRAVVGALRAHLRAHSPDACPEEMRREGGCPPLDVEAEGGHARSGACRGELDAAVARLRALQQADRGERFGFVPDRPAPGRVLTALLVHAGAAHFLVNMLALLACAAAVEARTGAAGFLAFYLLCGAAGFAGEAAAADASGAPVLGASGAVAGVLAAWLLERPRGRSWGVLAIPALVLGDPRETALVAHGCGFLAGALATAGLGALGLWRPGPAAEKEKAGREDSRPAPERRTA